MLDNTIRKGLSVWYLYHGEKRFSGYEIYDFLYDNGLIPSQIKSMSHTAVGSRLSIWYKQGLHNLVLIGKDKITKRKYYKIIGDESE